MYGSEVKRLCAAEIFLFGGRTEIEIGQIQIEGRLGLGRAGNFLLDGADRFVNIHFVYSDLFLLDGFFRGKTQLLADSVKILQLVGAGLAGFLKKGPGGTLGIGKTGLFRDGQLFNRADTRLHLALTLAGFAFNLNSKLLRGKNRQIQRFLVGAVLFDLVDKHLHLALQYGVFLLGACDILGKFLMYFIVVALSEEGFKFLFLKRATWRNPDYNYQFDGIVYAVSVSLGFALLENLSYVFSYGFSVAVIRAVTAVPGHACFGVFMGVWYGLAKMYANHGDAANEKKCLRMALLIPVLLHGAYDFIASLEGDYSWILFILFVIGLFFYTNRLLKRQSASDVRIG